MGCIAIIPARGGSKRLPRKNILPLAGHPIIVHAIHIACASGLFNQIIVSTDDAETALIAESVGARVIIRPDELATDEAHELDACMHVLDILKTEGKEPESFCVIYPTAAFLLKNDLKDSYQLLGQEPTADVVMGVAEFPIHPYKALIAEKDGSYLKMMFPVECKQRSQLYPQAVASSGTFYWFRTDSFRSHKTYYPTRLKGYVLPSERALDIDTAEDFYWAAKMLEAGVVELEKSDS